MTIHNLFPRLSSVFLSASIHAALGWALLAVVIPGAPKPGHAKGNEDGVLVVEMIPLDRVRIADAAGRAAVPHRDQSKPAVPQTRPVAATGPIPAVLMTPAAITVIADAGSAAAAATPTMADVPSADVAAYRARLQAHLSHYRLYPASAQAAGDQGVVSLHFIMDREGRVSDTWVETSSGVAAIDREALEAVLRAQPLPPLPGGWPDQLNISLPVRFKLG